MIGAVVFNVAWKSSIICPPPTSLSFCTTIHPQNFFIFPSWHSVPIKPSLSSAWCPPPTFYLCEFDSSKYIILVESYVIHPFVWINIFLPDCTQWNSSHFLAALLIQKTCLLGLYFLYFLSEKQHENLECLGLTHVLFSFKWADLKKRIYL